MGVLREISGKGIRLSHSLDKMPKKDDFESHIHDNYELFCLVRGDVDYIVEGNLYKLHSGAIMLMRSSETHRLIVNKSTEYERYVLNFSPSVILSAGVSQDILAPYRARALGERNMYKEGELFGTSAIACLEKAFENSKYIEPKDAILSSLLSLLCDILRAFNEKGEGAERREPYREIISYVNENLTTDITIEKIASHMHVSPTQASRIFKSATGASVHSYIIAKRLILFNKKLARGKGVIEACHECGFRDYSSFYRLYKKRFGKAPTQ